MKKTIMFSWEENKVAFVLSIIGGLSFGLLTGFLTWKDPQMFHYAIESRLQPHPFGYFILLGAFPVMFILYSINKADSKINSFWKGGFSLITMFCSFLIVLPNFSPIGENGEVLPLNMAILGIGGILATLIGFSAFAMSYEPDYLKEDNLSLEYVKLKVSDLKTFLSIFMTIILAMSISFAFMQVELAYKLWEPESARLEVIQIWMFDSIALAIIVIGVFFPMSRWIDNLENKIRYNKEEEKMSEKEKAVGERESLKEDGPKGVNFGHIR